MKKWMETGTYGEEAPEDQEKGVEMHVVCMKKEDVEARLAVTENETEAEVLKKVNKQKKKRNLRENGLGKNYQARELGEDEMTESIVIGMVVDRDTQMADFIVVDMRCDQYGGQVIWAKTGDYATVCQSCREPQ